MNMTSNIAADVASHLHSYTNLAEHGAVEPLMIASGDGVFVEDESGRRYLEGMSGLWCASLGFSHPRLVRAAKDALDRLPFYHTFITEAILLSPPCSAAPWVNGAVPEGPPDWATSLTTAPECLSSP